jgi:hypothetical protein
MRKEGKALLMGWFSFEGMGATAGDLMARDLVKEWIREAGVPCDIAVAPPFLEGVDWRVIDPGEYSTLVFVCGPFGNGWPITEVLQRFDRSRLFGVDLSLLQPLDEWNPFDFLMARDSSKESNPDITFAAAFEPVPVVGVIKVHKQTEYGERGLHDKAHALVDGLLGGLEVTRVEIDTRLDINSSNLRTPREVISAIAKMDVVVTTRLHGTVLALSQGVPALAIDPVAGGAKIARQARTIGWPAILLAETADERAVMDAYSYCLTNEARRTARLCSKEARERVIGARDRFLTEFGKG